MAGFDSFAPSVSRNPGQPAGSCLQSSHCGLTYDSDRKGTKERAELSLKAESWKGTRDVYLRLPTHKTEPRQNRRGRGRFGCPLSSRQRDLS